MMITTAPEVDRLIDTNAPIVICVSGGKDSHLVAEHVVSYARNRNHAVALGLRRGLIS